MLSQYLEKAASYASTFPVAVPLLLVISFAWVYLQSLLESRKFSIAYFARNIGFITLVGLFFLYAGKTHYFDEAVMAGPPPF